MIFQSKRQRIFNASEITVEAKVVENYAFNERALSRVAFLTDNELGQLVRNLDTKMVNSESKGVKRLEEFQNGLKSMVETVIGSTGVGNLTIDEAWRIIFGAPFAISEYKILKDVKLNDLETLKKQKLKKLKEFIDYFHAKTEVFLDKQKTYSSG